MSRLTISWQMLDCPRSGDVPTSDKQVHGVYISYLQHDMPGIGRPPRGAVLSMFTGVLTQFGSQGYGETALAVTQFGLSR